MTEPRRVVTDDETADIEPGRSFWSRHKGIVALLAAVVLLVGGGVVATVVARDALAGLAGRLPGAPADYPGPGGEPVQVVIPAGTSLTGIAQLLEQADVVASADAFLRVAQQDSRSTSIQAGTYSLPVQLPAADAFARILDPASIVRNTFTLREGNRVDQQVAAMAKAGDLKASDFDDVVAGTDDLGLPSWAKRDAEGFLYPDTYEVPQNPTPRAMVTLATARFTAVADEVGLAAGAKRLGITAYQALVVASIIEKEVFREEDRAKVARAIYNRLDQGMTLGMDSTAIYASWRAGLKTTNYRLDSPYNTRVNHGLPPGPIGSPGRAALEAAVNPAEGDWLYFVTVDMETGETEFSADHAGFAASVKKWKTWCAQSEEHRQLCG